MEDGKTGFLVEPGNIEELGKAVRLFLKEKSLAEDMGRNGKNRVQTMFAKERYARQVEVIYMHTFGRG